MPGAFWSLGVRGSRNLQGRKRRLKIIRKGRVRREELGNGGRRAGGSREIVMHPSLPGSAARLRTRAPRGQRPTRPPPLLLPPPPLRTCASLPPPRTRAPGHPLLPPDLSPHPRHTPSTPPPDTRPRLPTSPHPAHAPPPTQSCALSAHLTASLQMAHTHAHTLTHPRTHRAQQLDARGHRASPHVPDISSSHVPGPPPPPRPDVGL